MFGGKKTKEKQDKIQELEVIRHKYHQLGEDVVDIKETSDDVFAMLDIWDMQIDQGLNHAADIIQKEREYNRAITEHTNYLTTSLEEIKRKSNDMQIQSAQRAKALIEGEKAGQIFADVTELCKELSKEEQIRQEKAAKGFEEALDYLDTMRSASKHMSSLALNAGIEAGRLGESGMEFLQAADNVRRLSEAYGKSMADLKNQLETLQEQFISEEYFKQINSTAEKMQDASGMLDVLHMESEMEEDLVKEIKKQQQRTSEIIKSLRKKEENYQLLLEQLEYVAKNHADRRDAKGDLEEKLSLFYGKAL